MRKSSIDLEVSREMIVGAFAFAVLFGLFWFSIFISGDVLWGRKEKMSVYFGDAMGLKKGDRVVVRGMTIGEVKEMRLLGPEELREMKRPEKKGFVEVICALQEPVFLKSDYYAKIIPTSILGGRHLEIYEGTSTVSLAKGELVVGEDPYDLIADASSIMKDLRSALEEGGAIADMKDMLQHGKSVARKIDEGEGSLGKLVNDEDLYNELVAAVVDVKEITRQIKSGKGTVSKLIYDDTIYVDLQASLANLKDVSERLKDGEGLLGRLLAEDDPLYEDTKLLMQDVRAAVDDFRETAPILTFTSVFFGAL